MLEEIRVDEININDIWQGKELEILDGIPWGCRYSYDLSEDMKSFTDNSGNIYIKLLS